MTAADASTAPRASSRALACMAVAQACLFAHYLHATIIRQPYGDMFSHVGRYLQYREDHAWWAYLWAPHVQHRHVWMRVLTALDIEWFAGSAYPFIVSATCCLLLAAWLLVREATAGAPRGRRLALASLVLMLVVTSVAAVDCALPINGIYPQALMFSVLALVLFEAPHSGEAAGARDVAWRRAGALLAAAAAAWANAAALALWPILVWLAWRGRAGWRWVGTVAIAGSLFTMWYVHGLPLAPIASVAPDAGASAMSRPLRMAIYTVTYLGLPWTRSETLSTPGRLLGALLLVAGLGAVLWHGLVSPACDRLRRLAVALILFTLATALLASVGRVDVGPALRAPVRYTVFLTPLHVGLLLLAWPHVLRLGLRTGVRHVPNVALVGVGVVLLAQQVAAGQAAVAMTTAIRSTVARFMAGESTPEMGQVVFPDMQAAGRYRDAIRDAGLYRNTR